MGGRPQVKPPAEQSVGRSSDFDAPRPPPGGRDAVATVAMPRIFVPGPEARRDVGRQSGTGDRKTSFPGLRPRKAGIRLRVTHQVLQHKRTGV